MIGVLQPQKVRFATSGLGNQPHLWGELFKTRNRLNMEFVAYKGAADALRDVMGGHVPLVVDVGFGPSWAEAK